MVMFESPMLPRSLGRGRIGKALHRSAGVHRGGGAGYAEDLWLRRRGECMLVLKSTLANHRTSTYIVHIYRKSVKNPQGLWACFV